MYTEKFPKFATQKLLHFCTENIPKFVTHKPLSICTENFPKFVTLLHRKLPKIPSTKTVPQCRTPDRGQPQDTLISIRVISL